MTVDAGHNIYIIFDTTNSRTTRFIKPTGENIITLQGPSIAPPKLARRIISEPVSRNARHSSPYWYPHNERPSRNSLATCLITDPQNDTLLLAQSVHRVLPRC